VTKKKLTIKVVVEDVDSSGAWVRALREVFDVLVKQFDPNERWPHDPLTAAFKLREAPYWDIKSERNRKQWSSPEYRKECAERQEFETALKSLTPKDKRLLLEYSMSGLKKGAFGRAFAAKNGAVASSVTTQLRRVFREHPEECDIISSAALRWREVALGDRISDLRDPHWREYPEDVD
jgi:hypothetical protein